MQPINQLIVRKKFNKMADNPTILTGLSTQPISFSQERSNVFCSIYKVFLSNGKSIETNTIISTIGSTVSKIIEKSGLPLKNGKIITNEFLQVSNLENIWAIGDSALIPNKLDLNDYPYSPPTAQFAVRQAKLLAKNIILKNLFHFITVPYLVINQNNLKTLQ